MENTPITLVLDLDETLVSVNTVPFNNPCFTFKAADGTKFYARKRPYLEEFLDFACKNYRIIVWSAGVDFYVKEIVKNIFPLKPSFVFSRDFCDIDGMKIVKPMSKLIDGNYADNPERILFIDDNPSTFSDNIDNALWIPEFNGEPTDSILPRLKAVLSHLQKSPVPITHLFKASLNQ